MRTVRPSALSVVPSATHWALPHANWSDAFVATTTATTARQALELMFARARGWPTHLLSLRNRLGGLIGLKPVTFELGRGSGFPLVQERRDEVILGFDDHHLDFRIVVSLMESGRVTVATYVVRHGLAGRAYIAFVAPFHRLIVRQLLG